MRVTIYWATKDGGLIDRIRKLVMLKEYEKQGFINLRNKQ